MERREYEQAQFEALGEIGEACTEALARTWARPQRANERKSKQTGSIPELEQLALPPEWGCPRLA
jgi:hypothetical protein